MTNTPRRAPLRLCVAALALALVSPFGCGPSEEGTVSTGQDQSELSKKRFDDAPAGKQP